MIHNVTSRLLKDACMGKLDWIQNIDWKWYLDGTTPQNLPKALIEAAKGSQYHCTGECDIRTELERFWFPALLEEVGAGGLDNTGLMKIPSVQMTLIQDIPSAPDTGSNTGGRGFYGQGDGKGASRRWADSRSDDDADVADGGRPPAGPPPYVSEPCTWKGWFEPTAGEQATNGAHGGTKVYRPCGQPSAQDFHPHCTEHGGVDDEKGPEPEYDPSIVLVPQPAGSDGADGQDPNDGGKAPPSKPVDVELPTLSD